MKKYICLLVIISFIFVSKSNAYISFNVGDIVSYNNINFYVIKDSDQNSSILTLIKAEPIKTDEIEHYISSTEIAMKVHLNNPYATIPYYTRDTCVSSGDISGCSKDYDMSDVKQVVDVWTSNYIKSSDLEKDSTGYSSRLLSIEELINNFGFEYKSDISNEWYETTSLTPKWLTFSNDSYWTMSSNVNSDIGVWNVSDILCAKDVNSHSLIRPVITIKKESIDDYNKIVEYNKIRFYVIKDDINNDRITLLKSEPIRSSEIKEYLSATEIASKVNTSGKYASMAYYSRDTCVSAGDTSGCITDYKESDVKQVVDIWISNYIKSNDLKIDYTGYSSRLLTIDDLVNELGYMSFVDGTTLGYTTTEYTPSWFINTNFSYYSQSLVEDSASDMWGLSAGDKLAKYSIGNSFGVGYNIRPVITLKRSAIYGIDESDNKEESIVSKVDVPNTHLSKSLIIIIIGFIFACVSIVIYYIIKKKYSERK